MSAAVSTEPSSRAPEAAPAGAGDLPLRLPAHMPALDGLRGLAVLAVMFYHFVTVPLDPTATPVVRHAVDVLRVAWPGIDDFVADISKSHSLNSAGRAALNVVRLGWTGVDLFFILSGFLITGILIDARGSDHYFRNFYARRTLRIFPLYYGVLAAFFLFAGYVPYYNQAEVHAAQASQGWLWLYCYNILAGLRGEWLCEQLNQFWSLCVEEHFYLVWPFLIWYCSRRVIVWICAAFIVGGLAMRIALEPKMGGWSAYQVLSICRFDGLSVGALLAIAARRPGGLMALRRPAWICLAVSGIAIVALIIKSRDFNPKHPLARTLGYTPLAFFFGAVVVIALTSQARSLWHRALSGPTLRAVGKYSFAMYVFHPFLMPLMRAWVPPAEMAGRIGVMPALVVHVMACVAATVIVALLSWHLYEKHFLALKRFVEYRKPAPAAGAL